MSRGRTARPLFSSCALTLSLFAVPQAPPPPASFNALLIDLASAVTKSLAPGEQVQVASADAGLARDLRLLLERQDVRVVDLAERGGAIVSATCATTLRERVCLADLRRGEARELVSVHRPHEAPGSAAAAPLVLELRPILAQTTPILDLAFVGTQLLVLHPSSLVRYERAGDDWRVSASRAIALRRAWPRDLRGRLAVDATGLEVFLPGVSCRGKVDGADLSCSEGPRAWPLGLDNAGMAPSRNYFIAPDGREYYGIAGLGQDAGARWIAASQHGHLAFLDDGARPIEAVTGFGDDVASVATPCAPGSHVVVPGRTPRLDEGETLRVYRVAARRLVAVTPPVILPGTLSALWAAPGATSATVVSHNPLTDRYEAFQARVSCGR